MEYQLTVTVYKSLNELNPHYMNKKFSYTQENHSYGTHNGTSYLLAVPECNKSIGQKCISCSWPKVKNSIIKAIRCAPSRPSFKSQYQKRHVLYLGLGIGCNFMIDNQLQLTSRLSIIISSSHFCSYWVLEVLSLIITDSL